MCLIFFSINIHPQYKLVVAGNRDEFYNRQTAPAQFWEDQPALLGGRDLEAMGTWLGINTKGKISMLTNYRDPFNIDAHAPSRGNLVSDFLIKEENAEKYLKAISTNGKKYNGFNLLAGTVDELWYYSNYGVAPRKLDAGYYGLSNHLLDTPWPKVTKGKAKLERYFTEMKPDPSVLFDELFDAETALDDQLPNTGLSQEKEKALSSMFIKTNGYGSRCSTVILVDHNNQVLFSERVYDPLTFQHQTRTFEFNLGRE